ncbi:MAG TPA: hypothetical protein VF170_09535, partial [Planctomycetaceae bacterium]
MHSLLLVVGDDVHAQLSRFADWNASGTNSETKFDWYRIGGRWDGYLRLRSPRAKRRLFGLLAPRVESQVNVAKKREIDTATLLASPPSAVLIGGKWSEAPIRFEEAPDESWRHRFFEIFDRVPDDATLTVVDI